MGDLTFSGRVAFDTSWGEDATNGFGKKKSRGSRNSNLVLKVSQHVHKTIKTCLNPRSRVQTRVLFFPQICVDSLKPVFLLDSWSPISILGFASRTLVISL